MKHPILLGFLLIVQQVNGQVLKKSSTITEVVVYEKGASVTRTMEFEPFEGQKTIVFDSLPSSLDVKSILVESEDGLDIISVQHESVYYPALDSKNRIISNNHEIKQCSDSLQLYDQISRVINQEKALIENFDDYKSKEGDQVKIIREAAQLYASRLKEIYLELQELEWKKRGVQERINALSLDSDSLNQSGIKYKLIKVKVNSKLSFTSNLHIKYYVSNAAWYTFYDLRLDKDQSLLQQKAYISQNTGENWKDVQITLSNKSPVKKNKAPRLHPNFMSFSNSYELDKSYTVGQVLDRAGRVSLIGVNIILANSKRRVITDIDGYFRIHNPEEEPIICSYPGYKSLTASSRNNKRMMIQMCESQSLDEVVVSGYSQNDIQIRGSRSNSEVYYIDGVRSGAYDKDSKLKKEANSLRKQVASQTLKALNQINIQLEDPYSIPSNGRPYDVLVKDHQVNFTKNYYAVPALETEAYCKVGILDWQSYNLFSGKSNLYIEGVYGGETQLDIDETKDTLWVEIGSDPGLSIKRKDLKEFRKTTFLKKKIIQFKAFEIEVKNNKEEELELLIEEALPVSTDEDLQIKYLELSGGMMNEQTGITQWEIKLPPGGSRTINVEYEMKYGKGKKLK